METKNLRLSLLFILFTLLLAKSSSGQLGTYAFTGTGACPTQAPTVTTQPANAVFSSFSTVNATCIATDDESRNDFWNKTGSIVLTEYHQFSITANANYVMNLSSLAFTHRVSENGSGSGSGNTAWILRSNLDNYASNISTGSANDVSQTAVANLPAGSFSGLTTVTFRLYLTNAKDDDTFWSMDDVILDGATLLTPANPGDPTSNSPQCANPGVVISRTGNPPAGETWYWQTSAAGTSTANSSSTYTVTSSGIYYLRAKDNTTNNWSLGAGSVTVVVTPNVTTPVFTMGASSTRCSGAGTVTYTATASNSTGITYSIDAACEAAGNSIDETTGVVTYIPGWSGTAIVTASADGCAGPLTADHTVTITPTVGSPVFALGATTTRCQGAGTVAYNANASNSTGITYSLNAASISGGCSINATTGSVTYPAGWSGTTIVTASAAGCSGPTTAVHTVTVTATVGLPVFSAGASSVRCQGNGTVTYTATSTNNTGLSYSLDLVSTLAGNSINSATGAVSFSALWSGTSTITATATGCNGPRSSTHSVTSTQTVGDPSFSAGATSTRCQGAGTVNYPATASNNTGLTYSLDAASLAGGNSINAASGAVTYTAAWTGTTTVTVTAAGCNGPKTTTHTATITATVGIPSFTSGATSTRCQGTGNVTYLATATTTTGITYTLDAASLGGGNTISSTTADVTYAAGWSGTSIITASAAGCGGPRTATHTVTVTATVGNPAFTLGSTTTRCQGAASVTYTATATNNTGITYSLDATSLAGGNTINTATGAVTYTAAWTGTTTITVNVTGCNGPKTATHTVTITPTVGTPSFTLGATTTRCQGSGTVNYSATASSTTGITYSLDAASLAGGNSINASSGNVTYVAGWSGTSTITASAAGCGGPKTATHTVTITPTVGLPSFTLGATTTRCQGAGSITYTATATNNTGLTYSLDAASIAGGNTIVAATGAVTYTAAWTGTSVITASATGCNGPRTSNHTVTITATVGTPVFSLGVTTTRCQGAGSVTYTATATATTGITYALDAASLAGGNSINATTAAVSYVAGWSGTSTITASAAGCGGPKTATHTVTITPTVGTPVFTLGATTTRCQGAGSVTYSATATNNTGITYSLDASSIAAGNSINSTTGAVNYVAGWTGSSIITASATGCNGPRTSNHTVTITPSVVTPSFTLGPLSTRLQGAGTVTYTATASNTTGITYTLDAASLAGGNTINATTGLVTYTAAWSGISTITASAAGCNGPLTATHTVTINSTSVYKQLYLSDPSQALDRIDPVNTVDNTTATTGTLSSSGTTNTTFTMNPTLCSALTIKAGTITVRAYITVTSGTMPANPAITALIKDGAGNILSISNPSYNSGSGLLTWTANLAADYTVPAGQAISLQVTTAQAAVSFRIDFDSQTKPSRIDLPVTTFINITNLGVYTAAYPAGSPVISGTGSTTKYIRATVTDPFGFNDITALNVTITPVGSSFAATSVATSGCTRTYEYVWNTPATGSFVITATAKEGYENTVTNVKTAAYAICSTCAPVAVTDSASGAGGNPLVVDALANDYDPNNNINPTSISIAVQPRNGSAYISNNTVIYLPNGSFTGRDTLTYRICDLTSPTPLCSLGFIYFEIDPLVIDICADATKTHTYYIPYPESQVYTALQASASNAIPTNTIRTVISIKIPYSNMAVYWDEWEDGYETNIYNPTQSTTKVWGDGNPFNGIAPGFPNDIIPAGGSIVLDNTMVASPRNSSLVYYDGRDKVVSSGQLALTQVCGEPTWMPVQAIKTNVTSTYDFGQSFTIPLGQDFNSRDFDYTALFIRAAENNTVVSIDKDNNGTLETTTTLNEGQSYLLNGGVLTGATITSTKPVGVELSAGGIDQYSIRNAPIFPATWYGNTYYTPVPTSDNSGDNPKDSSVVMFYNSLTRPISINWSSGIPSSGTITIPAKQAIRFPLAYSNTAAYKFVNPTGESFTAIEIVDSYTPGSGGNDGSTYDWSFNLISEARLSDYTTVAWAPGGLDLVAPAGPDVNGNPIWVTPTANTTIYVKYDGNISGTSGLTSPCGLKYDVAYNVNALNYIKIRDASDNDQGGIAIYTCNGAKIAAVYGEDPNGSTTGIGVAYWDVGTTIQPFCKEKVIVAVDDYVQTMVNQPVTISILNNDFGFLSTIDPTSVSMLGLLQPSHGTVSVSANGTVIYTPAPGYMGIDTFEYRVCSTPSPIVCDIATVYVFISACPSNIYQNMISGQVFLDTNKDGINNDGASGFAGAKVYLYTDGNCSASINTNELTDSTTVDSTGFYQFVKFPDKNVEDDFGSGATSSCANGSDGDSPWATNWVDAGDLSTGFCNSSQSNSNTDVEIKQDAAFGMALRLKDNNVSATRTLNLSGSSKAFLTFSYRRKSATLVAGRNVMVQASTNGSTFTTIYTIAGSGQVDANYVSVYNQDISSYISSTTHIRFLTNNSVGDADTVYIDNVSIRFRKYNQCYITQLATSSIPVDHYVTSAAQRTTTFVNAGTCASQFDFGVAKLSISISGTLFNDANGLVDGVVNGTATGSPAGTTVYAYLVDSTGKVDFKTTVNSGTGAYSFSNADINSNYTVVLSTINTGLNTTAPSNASLPTLWASVGDAYGTNNVAGSSNESGTPNVAIAVRTAMVNVTNVNFGIERLPDSDDKFTMIGHPNLNQTIPLNGGGPHPPRVTGSDPEDQPVSGQLENKKILIDTIPDNAELWYNSTLLTNGSVITSLNSSVFRIKITTATIGDSVIYFRYSLVDAAGLKDPTPAKYTVAWPTALPADRLVAVATLSGNTTTVNWSTQSESMTHHFIVERSVDNVNFEPRGTEVPAAGNSVDMRQYSKTDDISAVAQYSKIFYRVKLVDLDGKESYSNIVSVNLDKLVGFTAWPNPFVSTINMSITTTQKTELLIRLTDMMGKTIISKSQQLNKGVSQVNLDGLDKLANGIYLLDVMDKSTNQKTSYKFVKE